MVSTRTVHQTLSRLSSNRTVYVRPRPVMKNVLFDTANQLLLFSIIADDDRYNGEEFHFESSPLNYMFAYQVEVDGSKDILIDPTVYPAINTYAPYFQATPFSRWTITIPRDDFTNFDLNMDCVHSIRLQFFGSVISASDNQSLPPLSHTLAVM